MMEYWKTQHFSVAKESMVPVSIKEMCNVRKEEMLLTKRHTAVSFKKEGCTEFAEKGSYIVLDFGKELCGGLRIITRSAKNLTTFRITLGESYTEACTVIGDKNAGNDHSPRDFEAKVPFMSDLTFGQSGFRFARIELLSDGPVLVKNIYAVNTLPYFEKEAVIRTNDEELNQILDTAAYTLKLCLQNGYIFDGIKRDRLVWCGDLHQEILNSIYLYGDNQNVTNALSFLKEETPASEWMNTIPSYSAWWVINLCDYCRLTGNQTYFEENKEYAKAILEHFESCIESDGTMNLGDSKSAFFLDWPTRGTGDAVIGTAAIIILAAQRFLEAEEFEVCHHIIQKLSVYLDRDCQSKQARSFQILAGRKPEGADEFLEKGGAAGFSTFMAYYILKADAMAGGKDMLSIMKEYFGAMLSRGATTFWEDFNMDWLKGSGRIDELPKEGERDIHGDYGAFCYEGFRHSLCHGWASGVLAFFIEYILGISVEHGGKKVCIEPHLFGIEEVEAKIPLREGWLSISIQQGKIQVEAPDGVDVSVMNKIARRSNDE